MMRKIRKRSSRSSEKLVQKIQRKLQPILEKAKALLSGEARLKRSKGPLAGVCQGIGEYFEVDPSMVRVGFFVATLITFGIAPWLTLLTYGVLAIFLPKGDLALNDSWDKFGGDWNEQEDDYEEEPVIVELKICENCNTAVKPQAKFCHYCGAKLEPNDVIPHS